MSQLWKFKEGLWPRWFPWLYATANKISQKKETLEDGKSLFNSVGFHIFWIF